MVRAVQQTLVATFLSVPHCLNLTLSVGSPIDGFGSLLSYLVQARLSSRAYKKQIRAKSKKGRANGRKGRLGTGVYVCTVHRAK